MHDTSTPPLPLRCRTVEALLSPLPRRDSLPYRIVVAWHEYPMKTGLSALKPYGKVGPLTVRRFFSADNRTLERSVMLAACPPPLPRPRKKGSDTPNKRRRQHAACRPRIKSSQDV